MLVAISHALTCHFCSVQEWFSDTQCKTRSCNAWGCTCQGLSNLYYVSPNNWGVASLSARIWYMANECNTYPNSGKVTEKCE